MAARSILPAPFKLERYFAKYEFSVKYLLCTSDPESLPMADLLKMADTECKELWENLVLSYTESSGHPLLKREVAKLQGLNDDQVLVVVPQEGIYIAMHCLADFLRKSEGDSDIHVIATFPAYQSLFANMEALGLETSYWTAKADDHSKTWHFSMDDLKNMVKDNTRILVANFPHNPTGFVPSASEWEAIVEFCKEKDIFLFSDEMYRFTNNDGAAPLQSACAMYEKAISLSGLSKTFALPGLRIGWLCTQHEGLMTKMAEFKDYLTICLSAPSEILSIIALRNKETLIQRTMSIINANLKSVELFFAKYPHYFTWYRPKACTTGFVHLEEGLLKKRTASQFCEHLLKESGILLVPASMYDYDDSYVRFGFGRKNVPEILKEFEKYLDTL